MFSRTGLLWRLLSMGMVATGVLVMLAVVLLAMPDSDEVFETQPGPGMEPTIDSGASVDVRVVSPEQIGRGNVVVFHPGGWVSPNSIGTGMVLVRRVVGIGGDQVACCDAGRLVVNGKPVAEEYLLEDDPHPDKASRAFSMRVPEGHVFVLGDNRGDTVDSRDALDLGGKSAIPYADVRGVVVSVDRSPFVQTSVFIEAGLPGPLFDDSVERYLNAGMIVGGFILTVAGVVWLRRQSGRQVLPDAAIGDWLGAAGRRR